MEISSLLLGWHWSSIIYTLLILLSIYYLYPLIFPRITGIPGPVALPILGSLLPFLLNKRGASDQHMKNLRKYGKIHKIMEGKSEALVCADPDLLKQLMVKDFTKFNNRRILVLRGVFRESLFDVGDEKWRRLRHLLTPSFTSGKLKKMMPLVDKCVRQMVTHMNDKVNNKEKVELKSFFGGFTMDVIATSAFGLEIDSQNDPNNPFILNARKIFDIKFTSPLILIKIFLPFAVPLLEALGFTLFPTLDFLAQFLKKTIKDRQDNNINRPDFLQFMMDAEKDEIDEESKQDLQDAKLDGKLKFTGLTSTELLAQAVLFFLAAYDTTSTTLAFTVYNLATNPECQEKVYEEISTVMKDYEKVNYEALSKMTYLEQCIQETLRMFPPLIGVDRRPTHDVTVNGLLVPADCPVTIPIYAIHHDPDLWPEPEKFKPERFSAEAKQEHKPFSHIPFGMGPRQCIGMRLGLMEIKMALVDLLQKYTFKDAGVPLDLELNAFVLSRSGVWVVPEHRHEESTNL